MNHVVYLDHKAKEFEHLKTGEKTKIIRGAMGRKLPYGKVEKGDLLYFIENNGDGLIKAKAVVEEVLNSKNLSKMESRKLVEKYQDELRLDRRLLERYGGKRYIVLITISNFEEIEPFQFNRANYRNMDDWLLVEDIDSVKS